MEAVETPVSSGGGATTAPSAPRAGGPEVAAGDYNTQRAPGRRALTPLWSGHRGGPVPRFITRKMPANTQVGIPSLLNALIFFSAAAQAAEAMASPRFAAAVCAARGCWGAFSSQLLFLTA